MIRNFAPDNKGRKCNYTQTSDIRPTLYQKFDGSWKGKIIILPYNAKNASLFSWRLPALVVWIFRRRFYEFTDIDMHEPWIEISTNTWKSWCGNVTYRKIPCWISKEYKAGINNSFLRFIDPWLAGCHKIICHNEKDKTTKGSRRHLISSIQWNKCDPMWKTWRLYMHPLNINTNINFVYRKITKYY